MHHFAGDSAGFDEAAERCMKCKVIYLGVSPKDSGGKPTYSEADLKYLDEAIKAEGRI